MRNFADVREAGLEIRRDLFKGPKVASSRVQQFTELQGLEAHERFGYSYSISADGFPPSVDEVIDVGTRLAFPDYQTEAGRDRMRTWLRLERSDRLIDKPLAGPNGLTEELHPRLISTVEGKWPAYRYAERMKGAVEILAIQLLRAPDTRRAYWPVFWHEDVYRSHAPTRVPCSLGYQFLIRKVNEDLVLYLLYYQRSADFEHFWLSDVWLAQQFQSFLRIKIINLAGESSPLCSLQMGTFIHFIASFHLFDDELKEIY